VHICNPRTQEVEARLLVLGQPGGHRKTCPRGKKKILRDKENIVFMI
jgi:hypothetical protein